MGFSQEEKQKKAEAITRTLNEVLEGKPYVFLLSVLYDFEEKTNANTSASFWGVRHIGNANILTAPFPIVNGLIKATVETFNSFLRSFSDIPISEAEENDRKKI